MSQNNPGGSLIWVNFPTDVITGYTVGDLGVILKTTDGGGTFVEETPKIRGQEFEARITPRPNPFLSFATVPGHEKESFQLYDMTGKMVGTYKGDRIGEGLGAGVYFLKPEAQDAKPVRIVKIR